MIIRKGFLLFCFVLSVAVLIRIFHVVSSEIQSPSVEKKNDQQIVVSNLNVIEPNHIQPTILKEKPTSILRMSGAFQHAQKWLHTIIPTGAHTYHPQSHTTVKYPPFVLPSPFRTQDMHFPTLLSISSYYQDLKAASSSCNDAICSNPTSYMGQYASWPCDNHPESCSKESAVVMAESKYLIGDVDIIENGVAFRRFDCGWPADHSKSFPSNAGTTEGHFKGTLAYLPVPQCMSFQHFIDGLLPKLVQMRDLIAHDKSIYYAVDKSFNDKLPNLILQRLGIPSDHVISSDSLPWSNGKVSADKLILSCRVPPLHPKLWQDAQEMLRLPWLESSWKQEKHIVLLFSRKKGTRNSGRLILNEDEIVKQISPVLEKKGYELVVFNPSKYPSLDALFAFLANVDMVIGPHGGAFYNMLFMRRGITVVECMPENKYFVSTNKAVHLIIYLQAMLLGDVYYNVLGQSSGNDNMIIDPSVILSIIREALSFRVCLWKLM